MQRTDSRGLYERKASVVMRIAAIRRDLNAAEACEAEIDRQIEDLSRERERAAQAAAQ